METMIQGSVKECVRHNVLYSLEIKSTCKSHESLEEASGKSGCVGITILLLQVSSDDKSSFVFEKIFIFVKLVGEYLYQGYSISSVGCDV